MYSKVELINNPYEQRLRILINGESVSVYSNLEKYMDEPFCYWCDKILQSIYEECNNGEFNLHFSSRSEEMKVMEKLAQQFPYCRQYSSSPLVRKTPLLERLKDLNTLVKKVRSSGYRVFSKEVLFIIPENLEDFRNDLTELEVKNSYCSINSSVISYQDYYRKHPETDVIILLIDNKTVDDVVNRLGISHDFCICIDDRTEFKSKKGNIFIYKSTKDELFNTIFECLLLSPLMEMFHSCLSTLSSDIVNKYANEVNKLQSTSLSVIPFPESQTIELGRSVRIGFKTDIPGYEIKNTDLNFTYSDKGIIRCNGLFVEGLGVGKTTLNIIREGEQLPCAAVDYTVIKRNRITELKLEDDSIVLGKGDHYKMNYSFLPEDADNESSIEWNSDDTSVVDIDKSGYLRAVGTGNCTIRCSAEQVSAKCRCKVKPYLQSITVDTPEMEMIYGASTEIKVSISPQNCIDDKLNFTSMNMQIVNMVGRTAKAIGCGTTKIVIQNERETIRKEIIVNVMTEKEYKKLLKQREKNNSAMKNKPKGLLARLFGKK